MPFISSKHVFWIKNTIKLTYIINSLYQQKYFSRWHLFLHIEKYFIYYKRYIPNLQILEAVTLEDECLLGYPQGFLIKLFQFCFPTFFV